MPKSRETIYIIVFLVLVFTLWIGLSYLPGPKQVQLPDTVRGHYDLSDLSFEDSVYTTAAVWDSWPQTLLLPEDLAEAVAPVPHNSLDYEEVQYVTHRLQIELQAGTTYGISYYSSNYSMRLFINGIEMAKAGIPATTREETESRVHKLATYFTAQSEQVEVVIQVANFVHDVGGQAPTLTIGTANNIARYDRNNDLKAGVVFGSLMTACLYYLVIFLMNRKQLSSLVFSLLCLLLALASGDFLSRLFPSYNWQLSIRLEYMIYTLGGAMLAILVHVIFPEALNQWVFRSYLALCTLNILLVLFTDSVFFTGLRTGFQAISILMILYGLFRLARMLKEKKTHNILAFLGILLFTLFIVADILLRYDVTTVGIFQERTFNAAGGMVLFLFCYAVVMSIEQSAINIRLVETRDALASAETRYLELINRNSSRKPPTRLSDFGLTKRESEIALLLLDGKSRAEIASLLHISMGTVNTHCTNVYRKAGVSNVTDLVRHMHPEADGG